MATGLREQDIEFAESLVPLRDGPRVRVTGARCLGCGDDILAMVVDTGDALGTFTVAAAVLRELAQQAHTDDCAGPVQWETEPVPTDEEK